MVCFGKSLGIFLEENVIVCFMSARPWLNFSFFLFVFEDAFECACLNTRHLVLRLKFFFSDNQIFLLLTKDERDSPTFGRFCEFTFRCDLKWLLYRLMYWMFLRRYCLLPSCWLQFPVVCHLYLLYKRPLGLILRVEFILAICWGLTKGRRSEFFLKACFLRETCRSSIFFLLRAKEHFNVC